MNLVMMSYPAWARGRSLLCAAVLMAGAIGCEEPPQGPVQLAAPNTTPEGQLKNVMRRLKFALDRARPAANSGVTSQRSCSYKLLESDAEADPLTAHVTIETRVEVDPDQVKIKRKGPQTSPIGTEDDVVDAAQTVDEVVYTLIYAGGRWELSSPAMKDLPETEEICFSYALSDG